MKSKKPMTFEQRYPTKKARDAADAVVDAMSLHESMAEHLRRWELAYLEAGGGVKGGEGR